MERDKKIEQTLESSGISAHSYHDHMICQPELVLNKSNEPYKVFTPYSKQWLFQLDQQGFPKQAPIHLEKLAKNQKSHPLSAKELLDVAGFKPTYCFLKGGSSEGKKHLAQFKNYINDYKHARDFPNVDRTSKLSVYIRHGCISVRDLFYAAIKDNDQGSKTWLNELIWREFYQMVVFHFPYVKSGAFQKKYQHLIFPGNETLLNAWKNGQTGFPIVDAAMRCLNETGWMHNRLRMIVSSFLTKILLVDWKKGERYFSWKLLDYEFASNNGGWQWASGTGCDAAPYFRIFNPTSQSKTYDQHGEFIKKWCPELKLLSSKQIHEPSTARDLPVNFELGKTYPKPIVNYKEQRLRALELYKSVSN